MNKPKRILIVLTLALTFSLSNNTLAVPIWITDGTSTLLGADNVLVGDEMFNVRFMDGTCVQLFNNCTVSAFPFTTVETITEAMFALKYQVLINQRYPGGTLYGDHPGFVNGASGYTDRVEIRSPYSVRYENGIRVLGNARLITGHYTPTSVITTEQQDIAFIPGCSWCPTDTDGFDTSLATATYAIWSRATAVPEPSTLALFIIGLIGLRCTKRKGAILQ